MHEPPYWQVGESFTSAPFCGNLPGDWIRFTDWVDGLPEQFVHLKELAETGRASDRSKLGHELLDAWKLRPSNDRLLRDLLAGLADGIAFRAVEWVRACDYHIKPDPAVLVLFED